MRLFIACEIPENLRKKLVTLQNDIGSKHASIKWVEAENIHLTMKFLGEVEDSKVDEIRNSLRKIRLNPFSCAISGFGVFPSESYVRVLWVGLEPAEKIEKLHDEVDGSLSEIGFKSDSKFSPHATLGRVNSVTDKMEFISQLRRLKEEIRQIGEPFPIGNFILKKSTLTPKGPVYGNVEVFDLT
jgi:2'-5' RNA ligase